MTQQARYSWAADESPEQYTSKMVEMYPGPQYEADISRAVAAHTRLRDALTAGNTLTAEKASAQRLAAVQALFWRSLADFEKSNK